MILADLGIRLKSHRPGDHKTLCPWCSHERKHKTDPCLSVTLEEGGGFVYHCHNCQKSGGSGKPQERKIYRKPSLKIQESPIYPPEMMDWFDSRSIGFTTLQANKVQWGKGYIAQKGETLPCVLFPYLRGDEIINIKYRTLDKAFSQEKDAEKIFYGLNDVAETCCIVEGEIDKLSLYEAGIPNAISVPDGAPAKLTPSDSAKFDYLKNCESELSVVKKFILAVDNDGPGKVLEEELARRLGKEKCWRVTWPEGCKDANDVLVKEGVDALKSCIEQATPYPLKGIYLASDFLAEILDYYDNGAAKGHFTGWDSLNPHYRVRPGELCIVTGTPGSGKSQWLDALTMNLAKAHGWKFGLCSFENPRSAHALKLASQYYRMPVRPGPNPHIPRDKIEKFSYWLDQRYYWISADDESPTFDWILEKAKALVYRYGINGLVIDPYNEIEHCRSKDQTETEYVSQILSKLRHFAMNSGVHVWFVAHPAKLRPNSDGNTPVPSLYEISGSANFVNKADVGVVIARQDNDMVEIHFKKVRFQDTGTRGVATLRYDKVSGTYSDVTGGIYSVYEGR